MNEPLAPPFVVDVRPKEAVKRNGEVLHTTNFSDTEYIIWEIQMQKMACVP